MSPFSLRHTEPAPNFEPIHSSVLPLYTYIIKRQEEWEAVTYSMLGGGEKRRKKGRQHAEEGRDRRLSGPQVPPVPKYFLGVR